MAVKTYGHERRAKVPAIEGTKAKLCPVCDAWFAAHGKERKCDRCVPAAEQRRRAQLRHYARLASNEPQRGSQSRTGVSVPGHTATPKSRRFSTKRQVNGTVSDGGVMCRELAEELAATIDAGGKSKASIGLLKPMTRAEALRFTRRNVNAGLQDPRDLVRYAA